MAQDPGAAVQPGRQRVHLVPGRLRRVRGVPHQGEEVQVRDRVRRSDRFRQCDLFWQVVLGPPGGRGLGGGLGGLGGWGWEGWWWWGVEGGGGPETEVGRRPPAGQHRVDECDAYERSRLTVQAGRGVSGDWESAGRRGWRAHSALTSPSSLPLSVMCHTHRVGRDVQSIVRRSTFCMVQYGV